MNARFSFLSLLLIVLFSAQISMANESAAMLARKAVSEDPAEAAAAIHELRALGPEGLETLMTEFADHINIRIKGPAIGDTPEWQRIATALDLVGQQKNNYISGLYWYTDLDEAKKAARESGKPILSLRLLGNLTDELSCANSRFFRTILYSDPAISALLRDRFVVFWHSVRPVPRITIEFGDGRKMQQTITGNSAHYLLDADGNVLDALPGLYSPNAFREHLQRWMSLDRALARLDARQRADALARYHADRSEEVAAQWSLMQEVTGFKAPRRKGARTNVYLATPLAQSKMAGERTLLRQLKPGAARQIATTGSPDDDFSFEGVVAVDLSPAAIELIRRKQYGEREPAVAELQELLGNLRRTIAGDTIFNEGELHGEIHRWFARGDVADLSSLNERIYEELFLAPSSDPWMGLKDRAVFTGIPLGE